MKETKKINKKAKQNIKKQIQKTNKLQKS